MSCVRKYRLVQRTRIECVRAKAVLWSIYAFFQTLIERGSHQSPPKKLERSTWDLSSVIQALTNFGIFTAFHSKTLWATTGPLAVSRSSLWPGLASHESNCVYVSRNVPVFIAFWREAFQSKDVATPLVGMGKGAKGALVHIFPATASAECLGPPLVVVRISDVGPTGAFLVYRYRSAGADKEVLHTRNRLQNQP